MYYVAGSCLISEDESTHEQSTEKSEREPSSQGRSKKRKLQSSESKISKSAPQGITKSSPDMALAIPSSDQQTQGSGMHVKNETLCTLPSTIRV